MARCLLMVLGLSVCLLCGAWAAEQENGEGSRVGLQLGAWRPASSGVRRQIKSTWPYVALTYSLHAGEGKTPLALLLDWTGRKNSNTQSKVTQVDLLAVVRQGASADREGKSHFYWTAGIGPLWSRVEDMGNKTTRIRAAGTVGIGWAWQRRLGLELRYQVGSSKFNTGALLALNLGF